MKCRHCGKDYGESYAYCPYCAEPKYVAEEREDNSDYIWTIVAHCIAIPIGVFVGVFILFFFEIFLFAAIPAAIAAVISLILVIVYHKFKSEHRRTVEKQFYKDKKSICPICGSHSVALGRKGYDWKKGFWYRMFDIKGGHYLAGVDSRRVTAHCQNCGHSWLTDEEWIK